MPSLVIVDDAGEQFSNQEPRYDSNSAVSKNTGQATHTKSNLEQFFATIKPSTVNRQYFDNNYSNNALTTDAHQASHAKVEEVKKLYLQQESSTPHNDVLENDRCLFTPGKVSQIAEIFRKQYGVSTTSKKRMLDFDVDNRGTLKTYGVGISEGSSISRSKYSDASYSWVFGEYDSESSYNLAEERLPQCDNDANPHLGGLSSFKQVTVAANRPNGGVLNEVLSCNVIDQQTCDWRSVKKELKSNLEKLKPVAVIDPLNLPLKMNGLETRDEKANRVVSPLCLESTNTAVTNEYVEGIGYLEYVKDETTQELEKQRTIKRCNDRSLSPIPELENDAYSSTLSVSTDHSSSVDSGEFYLNAYRVTTERSFLALLDEMPNVRVKYEVDENDNVKYINECNFVAEEGEYLCSISLPANLLEKKCKSECQVYKKFVLMTAKFLVEEAEVKLILLNV
jgi:hypothetical protein